jgi:hypothetical protein
VNDPQILPAAMQELSIKKMLATDMKKSVRDLIEEISYVLFWGPFRALRM